MSNTGYILPQSASSTSETGWDDSAGAWINPENIYGAGEAAITDNAFDANNHSHVLRAFNFNLSGIPVGATIVGVMCRVYARSTSTNSSLALVQLLDIAGVRVGTNLAATPVNVTTTSAEYVFGAADNLWGNALTEAWIKDVEFGVGVGMIDGANNADCFIDSVEIDVYYEVASSYLGTPGLGELLLTGLAATVFATNLINVTPSTGELVLAGFAPTVAVTNNINVTPATGELTINGLTPDISVTVNQVVTPGTGELLLSGYAPTVAVTDNKEVTPDVGAIVLTGFEPTIAVGSFVNVQPDVGQLTLTGLSPTVFASNLININAGVGEILLTGLEPIITVGNAINIQVGTGEIVLTGFAPTVGAIANVEVLPGTGEILLTGFEPVVSKTEHINVLPGTGQLVLNGFAPVVGIPTDKEVFPLTGELVITGYAPTVNATANITVNKGTTMSKAGALRYVKDAYPQFYSYCERNPKLITIITGK